MAAPNTNYEPPPAGNKQQGQAQGQGQPQGQGGQQGQQGNETVVKKRVYIGNLPPETSREELRELGSKYGRVIQVELIRAKDGRLPFGFITFLSEEDAGYTAYMLHDHVYKSYPLEASLSPKQQQPRTKPGAPRQGNAPVKGGAQGKPPKQKKPAYSLRTLTPLNPPTQTNQAVQPNMKNYTQTLNDDQGLGSPIFGWTDNTADVPQAPLGRTSNPGQNNQDFNSQPRNNKYNNDSQGSNRTKNNNNRNRGVGGAYRRAQDTPQFEGDEVTHDDFDNTEQIPVVVQDSPPALNQLPPQDTKRQNQKGQNRNPNTNNPKGGQQKNKLGSNSGGPQTVNASIQYTQGGPTSNVQVNVATAPKKISINFKLNLNQLDDFLNVIQPYVQEETQ